MCIYKEWSGYNKHYSIEGLHSFSSGKRFWRRWLHTKHFSKQAHTTDEECRRVPATFHGLLKAMWTVDKQLRRLEREWVVVCYQYFACLYILGSQSLPINTQSPTELIFSIPSSTKAHIKQSQNLRNFTVICKLVVILNLCMVVITKDLHPPAGSLLSGWLISYTLQWDCVKSCILIIS